MLLPNLPPPTEGIHFQGSGTEVFINQRSLGTGSLYIAESRLSWAKDGTSDGLSLEYPHIAVHAVSRDADSFPSPCLYLMLDIDIAEREAGSNGVHNSDSEDESNENTDMTEIRFVPSDSFALESMYKALNECQILHPDQTEFDDDEFIGEYGADADEGVYELNDHDEPGAYENNMEGELEDFHQQNGDWHGTQHDNENGDMDTDRFDDALE